MDEDRVNRENGAMTSIFRATDGAAPSRLSQLRWRLVVAFLAVSVGPVLAASFIAAQWITSQFDNRLDLWLQDAATFFAKSINSDQDEAKHAGAILAASLSEKIESVQQAPFELGADLLRSVGYDFVAVYGDDRRPVYKFGDFDSFAWLPLESVATFFPIISKGEQTLVLGAATKFSAAGQNFYVFVGNRTSDEVLEISGSDTSLRIQALSVLDGRTASLGPDADPAPKTRLVEKVVEQFKAGANSTVVPEPGGRDAAIGFAALRDVHGELVGLVVSRLAENIAFPAPLRLLPIFAVLSLLSGLLSLLVALALSKRIARPIRALTVGVSDIAAGDYKARVREEGSHEQIELAAGFNAMATNLERLHELESQMRRSERFAALGEAAAAIAHEIRNPLGIIKTSSEVIRMKSPLPEGAARLIGFILEEVDRIDDHVRDLLDYVRPRELRLEPIDLHRDVVVRALEFVTPELQKRGLTGAVNEPVAPTPILGDRDGLHGALLNIFLNAMDATPPGGRLTVLVRNEDGAAIVAIEDTGSGVPDELKDRIFEPFVTSKPKGTGLGLAKVRSVIEQHGGTVGFDSVEGEGSTFRLSLPLRAEA